MACKFSEKTVGWIISYRCLLHPDKKIPYDWGRKYCEQEGEKSCANFQSSK